MISSCSNWCRGAAGLRARGRCVRQEAADAATPPPPPPPAPKPADDATATAAADAAACPRRRRRRRPRTNRGDDSTSLTKSGVLKPVYFAYDSIVLTEDARGILQKNAEYLKSRPTPRSWSRATPTRAEPTNTTSR